MLLTGLVSLGFGEALVHQSSGRHRGQPALSVDIALGPLGRLGAGLEFAGTWAHEGSAEIDTTQLAGRASALALYPLGEGAGRFEVGLGPSVAVTATRWDTPALGTVTVVEPGLRLRAGLGRTLGERWFLQARTGVTLQLSGSDADFGLAGGLRW